MKTLLDKGVCLLITSTAIGLYIVCYPLIKYLQWSEKRNDG